MWIFMNDAFLSIVEDENNSANLLVRARFPGDIEAVFDHVKVALTSERDYRYRASIPREVVAQAIAERVEGIEYPNFKGSVRDLARHDAYMNVWAEMLHSAQRMLLALDSKRPARSGLAKR